jgi:hypothetical protein
MKIVIIGDLHGNPIWKNIVEKYRNQDVLFIFLGDYFDSRIYNTLEQIYNFNELIEFKKSNLDRVILLIGNHDWEYFPEKEDRGLMSGFQGGAAFQNISPILYFNKEYLQAAYSYDNMLFTHAGVSIDWLNLVVKYTPLDLPNTNAKDICEFVNYVFYYKPNLFNFISGGDAYGDDSYQSPFWIRPRMLMRNNQSIKKIITQIVGHTSQNKIDIKGKATGKRYFFIDTINSNSEYLVIENKNFKSYKIY